MNETFTQKLNNFYYNSKPLPLRLWASMVVTSLLMCISISLFLLPSAPSSQAFFEYNQARLQTLSQVKPDEQIKIILLGDSRLRYATFNDAEMQQSLSSELATPVNVVRLVTNWAVVDDFSELMPYIIDANPNLVIMQESLISKTRTFLAGKKLAREYLFWRYLSKDLWDPGKLNQADLQEQMQCSALNINETVEQRRKRAFKWYKFSNHGEVKSEITQLMQSLETRHIPIVFVSIPITKGATEGLPLPPKQKELQVNGPEEIFPDSFFCDTVHMNTSGRELYSKWLGRIISKYLNKG